MIGEDLEQATGATSLEALLNLQRQDAESRQSRSRSNQRFGVSCKVSVEPGNSSDRTGKPIAAVCNDLSVGGCCVLAPRPHHVGDIYWLKFDTTLHLPAVFARCVRCRLLREDAFESGFQFFNEIVLKSPETPEEEDLVDMI